MRSPLLTEIPVLPGLHIDAQHVIGERREHADRAWFDVIALADGRTAMLVGDLVEPGAQTTSGTARLRPILTEMLPNGRDLDAVLERMSKAAFGDGAAHGTTLSVVVLDPRDGNLDYSTCAHPPPLVVTADGRTRPLRSTGGEDPDSSLCTAIERERLAPDDVLVLHTGGCSPALPAAALDALPILAREASEHARADERGQFAPSVRTEEVCRAAAAVIGQAGTHNDVAVLAAQLKPPVPRLKLIVPGVMESLAPAAQAVGDWLAALRSSVEDGAGMALAMGEAVTNAIQHAFVGARPGSVLVECRLRPDGMLVCSVSDDGRWLPSESAKRDRAGRGLRVMARVCDRILIRRELSGTVVELRRRVHRRVIRSVATPGGSG